MLIYLTEAHSNGAFLGHPIWTISPLVTWSCGAVFRFRTVYIGIGTQEAAGQIDAFFPLFSRMRAFFHTLTFNSPSLALSVLQKDACFCLGD